MTIDSEPFFSIILLTHTPQSHLAPLTIESIEKQTFKNYEFLADLTQAKGRYVHILRAGEYYIGDRCLEWMAESLAQENFPDVSCTGFIQHHGMAPTEFLYYSFSKPNFVQGKFPSLSSCWWERKTLLEFMPLSFPAIYCRYVAAGKKSVLLNRILVDYVYHSPTPSQALADVSRVGKVILNSYGPRLQLALWISRLSAHFLRWWVGRVKKMFRPI